MTANGVKVHSKLETGKYPDIDEVIRLIEN
ncbi:hypothetical protein G159_18740 [Planococcus glaciei CHR43]|nr:hypothetical protein G159_18740 [Planococcus glaciei CHR43]